MSKYPSEESRHANAPANVRADPDDWARCPQYTALPSWGGQRTEDEDHSRGGVLLKREQDHRLQAKLTWTSARYPLQVVRVVSYAVEVVVGLQPHAQFTCVGGDKWDGPRFLQQGQRWSVNRGNDPASGL